MYQAGTFLDSNGRGLNVTIKGHNVTEIFQRKMVHIFGNIPGVLVYFDDLGIDAESEGDRYGARAKQ